MMPMERQKRGVVLRDSAKPRSCGLESRGSGFCLLHLCTLSVTLRRFPEKAGFMSCTVSAVAGLFHLGTPILYRYLSDLYTWRGTLLMASAIILHTFIFGLLLTSPILQQPTPAPSKEPPSDEEEKAVLNLCATGEDAPDNEPTHALSKTTIFTSDKYMCATAEDSPDHHHPTPALSKKTPSTSDKYRCATAADAGSEMEPTTVVDGVLTTTTTNQLQRFSSSSNVDPDPSSTARRCCVAMETKEVPGRPTGELEFLELFSPDPSNSGPGEARVRCSSRDGDGGDVDVAKTGGTTTAVAVVLAVVVVKETLPPDRLLLGDRGSSDFTTERTSCLQSDQQCTDTVEDLVRCVTTGNQLRDSDPSRLQRSPPCSQSGSSSSSRRRRGRGARIPGRFQPASSASFLTNPLYACVLLNTGVILVTIFCFILLVLDFAAHKGWPVQDGVFLNFVFMLSTLSGRVLVGVGSLHGRVSNTPVLIGFGVIGSVGLCFVGQVEVLSLAAVCYACMGVGYGVTVGIFPAAVLDITGPGVYPLSLGLLCTVEGILDTVMGILTGALVDVLQSYSTVSLVYGLISLAFSVLLLVVFLTSR